MMDRSREPIITIDGPAGAGKSTVARLLATRLGYRLLDTGGMYRAIAWSVAQAGIDPDDAAALARHLATVTVTVDAERFFVNGHDVSDEIRTPEIGALTSRITALAPVRDKVTPLQRWLASEGGVVLEGRDTGTVVCPDAEVKFFLDASIETRARRRQTELAAAGRTLPLAAVRDEIRVRDAQDRTRALAPLRKAQDAIEVDTSERTTDDVVASMLEVVERQRCCTRS
ncbi:MAG TPA: (d)CMP kinase [Methylomirabilota bacterium]|jgi:cytidylate kinase|nr:(d)CMP kinase [Methylomirabilota bacterium]